jgi:antitoxin PrlF
MHVATLTSKYQATIPRAVREALAVGYGDRIEFTVAPGGEVRITKLVDPEREYLKAIETVLSPEWLSDSDEQAYRDL